MKHALIVGAGISGLFNAHYFQREGWKVTIIHDGHNAGSTVAAGQINPLVFRRMLLSWRAAQLIPFARSVYEELQASSNKRFLIDLPIRRLFAHQQERDLWIEKCQNPAYTAWMKELDADDDNFPHAIHQFGTGKVVGSFAVEAQIFLPHFMDNLQQRGVEFQIESFDYHQCNPEKGEYGGQVYDLIVFCQGYSNFNNPYFNYLPVHCTKGELLTIQSANLYAEEALNRKCFILPLGEQLFKVGATYEWNTTDLSTTPKARKELLALAAQISSSEIEVVQQKAGIRPTTPDRRPIIGLHPAYNKLSIFNGLGTKGYMLAPRLAWEWVQHYCMGSELEAEVKVERFKGWTKRP